ncbi:hypothetical protein [Clostridium scatologenes]|uniref:Putative ethanolamine utilization protein n=1 Tax=Clostridium scatologenes TaxID=1548 RepID=A0A0E3M8I2_CLOSL|nr:hypothetical protein [Clostridium scatologenes]AKA68740.1 putative ethanolamine utilization protein [Clostridium scatologenes]
MEMEKLVEMITKEVMKRIKKLSYDENRYVKDKILLLGDCFESSNIKEALEEKYIVDLYNSDVNVDCYKAVVLSKLNLKVLSNLALGLCNGQYEEIIINALFKGKRVYVLEDGMEYRKYMSSANKNLYKLYTEYEQKLMYNGVDILNEGNLIRALLCGQDIHKSQNHEVYEDSISEKIENKQEFIKNSLSKKLITEVDLRRLYMDGVKEINILKKSILTPLAQDFIRINHLKIKRV